MDETPMMGVFLWQLEPTNTVAIAALFLSLLLKK